MKLRELYEDGIERSVENIILVPSDTVESINLSNKDLTSLKGCPSTVKYSFRCNYNHRLHTLQYAPKKVGGDFGCRGCSLTSLEGAPATIGGEFDCSFNKLTDLRGAPLEVDSFSANSCGLTNLKGAPTRVNNYFTLHDNKLTSLHNIHKHIKYVGGNIDLSGNPIKSHVLGLLLIEGLMFVQLDNEKLHKIINSYLGVMGGSHDVIDCQEELIDAGYEEFAQL